MMRINIAVQITFWDAGSCETLDYALIIGKPLPVYGASCEAQKENPIIAWGGLLKLNAKNPMLLCSLIMSAAPKSETKRG